MTATADLITSLDVLRGQVASLRLPLAVPGADDARTTLARVRDQLDDYLLPRLRAHDAPLLVVVGGSTGAGKSTLVNSLLGRQVTATGVLRPTTRTPVLVHHPLDERWFAADRILPALSRVHGGDAGSLRLVASDAVPRGLGLLDAPDVDSVVEENRRLAAQLMNAADQWLFVTTAARYADAVPWDLLIEAAARRAEVALVLDRVDPGAEAVATDLGRMMADHGLGGSRLFVVPETALADGLLPPAAVEPLRSWLESLAADAATRSRVIDSTRDGAVAAVVARSRELAVAADAQREADRALRRTVRDAYDDAVATVRAATSDGVLLRGEVLARWQDFVGTGEFFRAVEERVGRLRDRVTGWFRGRANAAPAVQQAITHGLQAVILDAAHGAAERTYRSWRADPAGAALLDGLGLAHASDSVREQIADGVRAWQGDVLVLVGEQAEGRRGAARVLSLGVNGLGVSLMIVVFASTGGLTGAEVGIAGGTAVLAQRLLEAVFGDEAVRRLARTAQDLLDERVTAILDGEAERFTAQLDALGVTGGTALRAAADAVARAAEAEAVARGTEQAGPPGGERARRWWRR